MVLISAAFEFVPVDALATEALRRRPEDQIHVLGNVATETVASGGDVEPVARLAIVGLLAVDAQEPCIGVFRRSLLQHVLEAMEVHQMFRLRHQLPQPGRLTAQVGKVECLKGRAVGKATFIGGPQIMVQQKMCVLETNEIDELLVAPRAGKLLGNQPQEGKRTLQAEVDIAQRRTALTIAQ